MSYFSLEDSYRFLTFTITQEGTSHYAVFGLHIHGSRLYPEPFHRDTVRLDLEFKYQEVVARRKIMFSDAL